MPKKKSSAVSAVSGNIIALTASTEDKTNDITVGLDDAQKEKLKSVADNMKEEHKNFRINSKTVFFTYSQCDLEPEEIYLHISKMYPVEYYIYAKEFHKNGKPHVHLMLGFERKIDVKNVRLFDIKGFHPNFQTVRNRKSVIDYIKKTGNFKESGVEMYKLDLSTPIGFLRRKADYDAWIKANEDRKEINYPLKIDALGIVINKPDPAIKKRNYWIKGKANMGKTFLSQSAFEGQKVFLASKGSYPYEDYADEDIIIYDDYIPAFEEVSDVCNTWKLRKRVYGNVRYTTKYWKMNHCRTVIIFSNETLEEKYTREIEPMKARFIEINLNAEEIAD